MEYEEYYNQPIMVEEADYAANDVFKIVVEYNWNFGWWGFLRSFPATDYTVQVYSKQSLSVVDSDGNTNMLHMDG